MGVNFELGDVVVKFFGVVESGYTQRGYVVESKRWRLFAGQCGLWRRNVFELMIVGRLNGCLGFAQCGVKMLRGHYSSGIFGARIT